MGRLGNNTIFLLENDEAYKDEFLKAATRRGLDVEPHDLGENDPQKAAIEVRAKGYSLALVDRRARDDNDPGDISGLIFAEELHNKGDGTCAVLITAQHVEVKEVFDMLRNNALGGVVSKHEVRVHVLFFCVEHFRQFGVFPNGIARFVWLGDPPLKGADIDENLESDSWRLLRDKYLKLQDEVEIEELELVLRALISPCVTRVKLKIHGHQGQGGTLLLRAKLTNVDTPVSEDLAIKLGKRQVIKDEMLRYDRFVGPLPDGAGAQLRLRAETDHLAAIAYSWVGNSVEEGVPFADLVRSDDDLMGWRMRHDAVGRLFSTTLHQWYTVYRESGDSLASQPYQKLWDHYAIEGRVWSLDRAPDGISLPLDKVKPEIFADTGESWIFKLPDTEEKLPDPTAWAKDIGNAIVLKRLCPSHGDMHVRNVYVLPDGTPRLIDFGRTNLSHVFRDFAAIETSIRMTCVGTPKIQHLRKAEDILSRVNGLGDAIKYEEIEDIKEAVPIREALRATAVIRRAALDAYVEDPGSNAMREYLFALVMHLLRYAAGMADECASKEAKNRKREVLESRARRIWYAHYVAAKAAELDQAMTRDA